MSKLQCNAEVSKFCINQILKTKYFYIIKINYLLLFYLYALIYNET